MQTRALFVVVSLALWACATPQPGRRGLSARAHHAQPLPADAPAPERMRVHVIDVGQGAATLFEFPCAAVLVDTGGEDTSKFDSGVRLSEYLGRFFVRRADLKRTFATVFVTHPHIDHTRNLPEVMKRFEVLNLVTNGLSRAPAGDYFSGGSEQEDAEIEATAGKRLRIVRSGSVKPGGNTDEHVDAVKCKDVDPKISVLWGGVKENPGDWSPRAFGNPNNHSVVVRVEVDGHAVLVTADLEEEGIAALLALHEGTPALTADVYEVGHHGSANGTTQSLLDKVKPCIAVISMGDKSREEEWSAWDYGHPRKPIVDMLDHALKCGRPQRTVPVAVRKRRFEDESIERAVYGTGWDGTVWLELSAGGGWKVTSER